MSTTVIYALIATLGTWFVTALGAASVIFFKSPNKKLMNGCMGFASGVMIAASFFSLLEPAVQNAQLLHFSAPWLTVVIGFLTGGLFLYVSDKIICKSKHAMTVDLRSRRVYMLILAITLHNIPEGLAVGVAFGALGATPQHSALVGAVLIAVGIGLQNFPEGAAVSLPLRREGHSRFKSFLLGQASGIVEPIAGVCGAILTAYVQSLMPFMLSFAAGAMILVAVHELIPECQFDRGEGAYSSTFGIIAGFAIMMALDVALSV